MKNIWFIRHGQSESNAGLETIHPASTKLTDSGVLQAKYIADYLQVKPGLIIHSPYHRALQTAQPTMDKFPDVPVEQWPLQEFTYLSPQKYSHTTRFDRQQHVARYWQTCQPELKDGENAESFYEFIQRVENCHQRLQGIREQVFIFTHGHVMRLIIWMILLANSDTDYFSMQKYRALRSALRIPNGAILKTRLTAQNAAMSSLINDYIPAPLATRQD